MDLEGVCQRCVHSDCQLPPPIDLADRTHRRALHAQCGRFQPRFVAQSKLLATLVS